MIPKRPDKHREYWICVLGPDSLERSTVVDTLDAVETWLRANDSEGSAPPEVVLITNEIVPPMFYGYEENGWGMQDGGVNGPPEAK